MSSKPFVSMLVAVLLLVAIAVPAVAGPGGRGAGPVIYVTSQDLYYDAVVGPSLPWKGPFQLLEHAGPTGLQTEFGPGDTEYVGGRWWVDSNSNGVQDASDTYFSCPLLGPGRDNP